MIGRQPSLHFAPLMVCLAVMTASAQEPGSGPQPHSQYRLEIPLPAESAEAKWFDFVVPVEMFDGGRFDLADLRLFDAPGKEVPYALRVRLPQKKREEAKTTTFDSTTTPEGDAQLSLDLGENPPAHNEVEIRTPGENFRRRAILEGSDDRTTWNKIAEKSLLRFAAGGGFADEKLEYPLSRVRYLRARVAPDPQEDKEKLKIDRVIVRYSKDLPGEFIKQDVKFGPREPARQSSATGSAWLIDLGGENVPCHALEVDIKDGEFVRNYSIHQMPDDARRAGREAPWIVYNDYPRVRPAGDTTPEPKPELATSFHGSAQANGEWRRRAGEPKKPLEAKLENARAGRLRLFISDYSNPPLTIESVRLVSPVCQVVFENSPELKGPITAYFGNPAAEPPNYDFARNLEETLTPAPTRLKPGTRADNPGYIPPPLPFTERWRWLIHTMLGVTCLVLAAMVVSLARGAIARHDEAERQESVTPNAG